MKNNKATKLIGRAAVICAITLSVPTMSAGPFELNYSGRITDPSGHPVDGTIDLDISIYFAETGGDSVYHVQKLAVPLTKGLFSVAITPNDNEIFGTFDGSHEAWIEVTDSTHGVVYPRQKLSAVPYAYRVPVDGTSIDYNSTGKLTVRDHSLGITDNGTISVDTVNHKVGVGTSSPAEALHVDSASDVGVLVRSSGANAAVSVQGANGSNSSLDFYESSTKKANIYWNGATDTLMFDDVGGASAMAIDSSRNVGFGVTTPGTKVEIKGNGSTSATGSLSVKNSTGTSIMYVRDDGLVGVGTTTPSATLHTVRSDGGYQLKVERGGATDPRVYGMAVSGSAGAPSLFIDDVTAGATRMAIDKNGQVGIGTTTPSANLDVIGSIVTGKGRNVAAPGSGDYQGLFLKRRDLTGTHGLFFGSDSSGAEYWEHMIIRNDGGGGDIVFKTGLPPAPEVMRLTSGGMVNVTGNLNVQSTTGQTLGRISGYDGLMRIQSLGTAQNEVALQREVTGSVPASTGIYNGSSTTIAFFDGATSRVGIGTTSPTTALDVRGQIYTPQSFAQGTMGGTGLNNQLCYVQNGPNSSYTFGTCSSLRRYKDDIEDLPFGMSTLLKLRPVSFTWKSNRSEDLGFIAEEVQALQPRLASYDDKGSLSGVKYAQMSSLIVKAVQELYQSWFDDHQELDALKSTVRNQADEIQQLNSGMQAMRSYVCAKDPSAPFCSK